jgi:hypothetical protein
MCPSSGENTVPMRCLVFVTPYRVTNTRCCIGSVFSPDDGHTVARNMQRKAINTLKRFVQQAGSVYKIIQGSTVNKTYNLIRDSLGTRLRRQAVLSNVILKRLSASHREGQVQTQSNPCRIYGKQSSMDQILIRTFLIFPVSCHFNQCSTFTVSLAGTLGSLEPAVLRESVSPGSYN